MKSGIKHACSQRKAQLNAGSGCLAKRACAAGAGRGGGGGGGAVPQGGHAEHWPDVGKGRKKEEKKGKEQEVQCVCAGSVSRESVLVECVSV